MPGEFEYHGWREAPGYTIVTSNPGGIPKRLATRTDLANHSPDGFEWGYPGSGPAQLALAICADFLDDDAEALKVYQDFKMARVATIQSDDWIITSTEVGATIAAIRESKSRG